MAPGMSVASDPACERAAGTVVIPGGTVGDLAAAVVDQWLVPAPSANPAMLEMYRDRNRLPLRGLEPWAGEFAGKHLTSSAQVVRITGSTALKAATAAFVDELLSLQEKDGYLGPWPDPWALTNSAPDAKGGTMLTWDTWAHYHLMTGLLLWHEVSGDTRAFRAARRIADLLCGKYLDASPRLVETGWSEMNLAPVHALSVLYRLTGVARYLALAESIVEQFAAVGPGPGTAQVTAPSTAPHPASVREQVPLAGNYLEAALAGKSFHEMPRPRWESLHPVMGLAELFRVTGHADYREAFQRIWKSIRAADRHADGGFSSGEKATGNPYDPAPIETCCTVAWMAASVEMLKLTGDPSVADELELSTFNATAGSFSPSGRWACYNTPVDGVRKASGQDIVFQARAGSPELNCCSVNAPRGLGLISEWAAVTGADGSVMIAWLAEARITVPVLGGRALELAVEGGYPLDGRVRFRVVRAPAAKLRLSVRIPRWSAATSWRLGDARWSRTAGGRWLTVERKWSRGDTVDLRLDMTLHAWQGHRECEGLTAIYRGPLLLTWDRRLNAMDPDAVPPLRVPAALRPYARRGPRPPAFTGVVPAADGRPVVLCDFASAGNGGTPYRSWLPVEHPGAFRTSSFVPTPG